MKIHLPNSAFIGNIDPFLRKFDPTNQNKLVITANKKWISIHPVVLCMIASLGLLTGPNNIIMEKLEAKSKHYLARMGLFGFLGINSGIDLIEHESAGRFIPLTQISNSNSLSEFVTDMVPMLHLEPNEAQPIRYVVSELVRNVLEHSQSKNGAIVCAQYYKKSNIIRIGIVDNGVGVKHTIDYSYHTENDIEAIRLALMPGITGSTRREGGTETNAGAGLFFIKSMSHVNGSFFMIYSGNAMYKLLKNKRKSLKIDPFDDNHSKGIDMPYWQGTVVGVDISLSATHEFVDLLEMIRSTMTKAIRERQKSRYKKAKFI